jgi:hypothetical protein
VLDEVRFDESFLLEFKLADIEVGHISGEDIGLLLVAAITLIATEDQKLKVIICLAKRYHS